MFSFILSMARLQWAKWRGYETIAPANIQEARSLICNDCEFFKDGQCRICGCLIFAKAMLATERCPEHKWSRIWIKRELPDSGN